VDRGPVRAAGTGAVSKPYSQKFRLQILKQMVGPNRESGRSLSAETGVAASTLSRWLSEARSVSTMSNRDETSEAAPLAPKQWTAEQRLRVVSESLQLSDAELGEFLRRERLHESTLAQWRADAMSGLQGRSKAKRSPLVRRVRQLESELTRKEKALAETAALLVLQGKAHALWEVAEGENTPGSSGSKRSS
jgi:transposase